MAKITLVVFALLFLGSVVFAQGLACHEPSGALDVFQSGMCSCNSGYAPSTIDSIDCNIHPRCAALASDSADATGGNSPLRPTTSFADDRLTIIQKVPIVSNRKGSHIRFVQPLLRGVQAHTPGTPGADTCSYPGVLWIKTVDALDCEDIFTASMPWTQSGLCGFVEDANTTTTEKSFYKATLVHSFNETRIIGGKTVSRSYSTSYLLSVSFLTQKTVSLNDALTVSIADSTVAGFVRVAVTGNSLYDASSGVTIVEFTTTTAWPYQLDHSATTFSGLTHAITGLGAVTIQRDSDFPACPFTPTSECTQKWQVSISVDDDTLCDIAGQYNFQAALVCRDVNGVAASCVGNAVPDVDFSINMKSTDLCEAEEVDTSAQNVYTLTPFYSSDADTPTFTYQTGDKIYWVVEVVDPLVSISSVRLSNIEIYTSNGDTDVLLDGGVKTSVGTVVALEFENSLSVVKPGSPATLTFSFKIDRSALPNTIAQLGSLSTVQLTTSIVADISYHGNQQTREVDEVESFRARSSTISQSRTVQIVLTPETESIPVADANDIESVVASSIFDNSANSLHSFFGLFVALFVAVALKF